METLNLPQPPRPTEEETVALQARRQYLLQQAQQLLSMSRGLLVSTSIAIMAKELGPQVVNQIHQDALQLAAVTEVQ